MLLAILNVIVGIFGILTGITIDFITIGGELTLVSSFQLGTIFVGLFQIIAGYGLWNLKAWAWALAIFVTFFGLIVNIGIIILDFSMWRFYLLAMLIRVVILLYLMYDPIKKRFR